MSFVIRPFQPTDSTVVRAIACQVAHRGEPAHDKYPSSDILADLLTGYYVEFEPEHIVLIEVDSQVVGYVMGTMDNRRYGLANTFIILPRLFIKALWKGEIFRPSTWLWFKDILINWRRLIFWRKTSFNSHEGHCHIGVVKEHRHKQLGHHLMEAFLDLAKQNKVTMLMASVHSENASAARFFESLGFNLVHRLDMIGLMDDEPLNYQALLYAKSLE